ncbi:MAG: polysaccharide export protein [Proteobacteria bacterium]|nr:polysaccharide export protein [Desulfobacula sp.]MBU4130857.1 polysaccharide export protein [Pseudomonadota bacterium]
MLWVEKKDGKHGILTVLIFCILWVGSTLYAAGPADSDKIDDYIIGVGDILNINTWKEEDLSFKEVHVRNDGKITFPLLDDLPAEGKTTVELKKNIEKKLAEFVEAPSVTVTLMNPVSQRYYILGEVQEVGEYPLIKKLTVVQAFALAKGFTEWASKDKIILYRRTGQKEMMIKIDYDDIVKGQLNKDILLRADDIIIVP